MTGNGARKNAHQTGAGHPARKTSHKDASESASGALSLVFI